MSKSGEPSSVNLNTDEFSDDEFLENSNLGGKNNDDEHQPLHHSSIKSYIDLHSSSDPSDTDHEDSSGEDVDVGEESSASDSEKTESEAFNDGKYRSCINAS